MFVSEVFAVDATNNSSSIGASFANFIPLILIAMVFYFFIIRPHHKRLKELKRMVNQVKRGDIITTSGGIIGTVNRIDVANAQFIVEIAPKVEIKVLKSAISEVLTKEAQSVLTKETQSIVSSGKDKVERDNKNNETS